MKTLVRYVSLAGFLAVHVTAFAQASGVSLTRQHVRDELLDLEMRGYDLRSYYWQASLAAAEIRIERERAQVHENCSLIVSSKGSSPRHP